jgi:hypothetical protein
VVDCLSTSATTGLLHIICVLDIAVHGAVSPMGSSKPIEDAGKVEIGAFRTYPADYTPPDVAASEYQPIPLNKIEDFGVHASRYYSLDVSIFKTSLDSSIINLLWNKYWVNTLAASPLLSNKAFLGGQLEDVSALPPI